MDLESDAVVDPADPRFGQVDGLSSVYRLFLRAESSASVGAYTPAGFNLWLKGANSIEHDVVHLHEIHHAALNDDTAWGTALRVAFRHPQWRNALFLDLLAACTRTHEAFATYMSVHLVAVKKAGAAEVLASYPLYRRPYERMKAVADLVVGDHQRDLAVTAIARVCMQSPVLSRLAEQWPRVPQLAAVASIDQPDQRLRIVLGNAPDSLARLAGEADAAVIRTFGRMPSDYDAFLSGANDAHLDELWTTWEEVIFNGLAEELRRRGAEVISRREHLDAARRLIDLLNRDEQLVGLNVAAPDAPPISDFDESVEITRAAHYPVRDKPWPSSLAVCGADVEVAEVVRVVDATARVAGVPELVLHVRLPQRLLRTHACDERSTAVLKQEGLPPIVAVRAAAHDAADSLTLFHSVIPTPAVLADILLEWGDRGPLAVCVGASCFVSHVWQEQWLAALRPLPMVVLLDTGIGQLAGPAEGALLPRASRVDAAYLGMGHDVFRALLWHGDGQPHVNVHIADSLGIQLVAGQLQDLLGPNLFMDDADWSAWDSVLSSVLRSLLATESYFDLQALSE
jgi:hypothetical protein